MLEHEEKIIQNISEFALESALERYNTKNISKMARCFLDIFTNICDDKLISDEKYKKLISETLLDLKYAAGLNDCMSIRLHSIVL